MHLLPSAPVLAGRLPTSTMTATASEATRAPPDPASMPQGDQRAALLRYYERMFCGTKGILAE